MSLGPGSIVRAGDDFLWVCGDTGSWTVYRPNGVVLSGREFDEMIDGLDDDLYEVVLEADPVKSLDSLPVGSIVAGTDYTMVARKVSDITWSVTGIEVGLLTEVMLDCISTDGTYRVVYRGEEK